MRGRMNGAARIGRGRMGAAAVAAAALALGMGAAPVAALGQQASKAAPDVTPSVPAAPAEMAAPSSIAPAAAASWQRTLEALRADGVSFAAEGACPSTLVDTRGVAADLARDLEGFGVASGRPEVFPWALAPADMDWEGERVFQLWFPSPRPSGDLRNDTVWCRYYPARGVAAGERAPLALVLHHLGGDFTAEAILADFLARSGIHAIEVELPYYGRRRPEGGGRDGILQGNVEGSVEAFRQGIADVRRALDWALARPDVDGQRAGAVGISLGGILGSLAAGVDARLNRNVLIIAGGDLAGILVHRSRETRKVRAYCAEHGIGEARLRSILHPIEPLRFAHRIDRRGTLMLNAVHDEIVPRACTDALYEAIGRPSIHWYRTGHYTVSLYILDLFARTREHLLAPASGAADTSSGG